MPNEKQYKVLDPNGVIGFNGRKYAAGEIVANEPAAHVNAWLRFNQVELVTDAKAKGGK